MMERMLLPLRRLHRACAQASVHSRSSCFSVGQQRACYREEALRRRTYARDQEPEVRVPEHPPRRRLPVVIHAIVWRERRPAYDCRCQRRSEGDEARCRGGLGICQGCGRELLPAHNEHHDERDHVRNPDQQLIPIASCGMSNPSTDAVISMAYQWRTLQPQKVIFGQPARSGGRTEHSRGERRTTRDIKAMMTIPRVGFKLLDTAASACPLMIAFTTRYPCIESTFNMLGMMAP